MKFSDFKDDRNKRVVFLNNCLLNQTSRAPGVAYRGGAATELMQIVLDNGLNLHRVKLKELQTYWIWRIENEN
ncbi:MAG: hypothetical protein ACE5GO_10785 [Anaerolineales bacterium]